jgi:hypothetical protein
MHVCNVCTRVVDGWVDRWADGWARGKTRGVGGRMGGVLSSHGARGKTMGGYRVMKLIK